MTDLKPVVMVVLQEAFPGIEFKISPGDPVSIPSIDFLAANGDDYAISVSTERDEILVEHQARYRYSGASFWRSRAGGGTADGRRGPWSCTLSQPNSLDLLVELVRMVVGSGASNLD
jgi:hypothetical protein